MSHRRRLVPVVALLLGAAAFQGCGVAAGDGPQPGVAARVDGTEITLDEVDEMTSTLCEFFDNEAFPDTPDEPRARQRRDVAQTLINKAALEKLLEERDVALPEDYAQQLELSKTQFLGDLPDETGLVDAYVEAKVYTAGGAFALGDAAFVADGTTAGTAQESIERGQEELTAWLADHEVEVNPVFGFAVTDGEFVADDLSVAVADDDAEEGAPAAVTLPAGQSCAS